MWPRWRLLGARAASWFFVAAAAAFLASMALAIGLYAAAPPGSTQLAISRFIFHAWPLHVLGWIACALGMLACRHVRAEEGE